MKIRDYQLDAENAVFDYWRDGGGNPVVEAATGLGKSVILANIVKRLASEYPNIRILMLTHVKELIVQNYKALLRVWPNAPAGIYNAGLGRKDYKHQIIYGSVQSVANNPKLLAPRHCVLIDEAHLVSPDDATRYQSVLRVLRQEYERLRVVGLTATPYRLDSGILTGEGQLFDDVVYKYNIGDGIRDGWLSPVTSTSKPSVSIDTSKVALRGGEFLDRDLQAAAGDPAMILAACEDMLKRAAERSSILIFCVGIDHAAAVVECLVTLGETAAVITGNTASDERGRLISEFRSGAIRFIANVGVLTTGFDAPELDCIALMRPTLSTSLYVQMIGRGTRVSETVDINSYETADQRRWAIENSVKPDCLVLDYAGNLQRHGPVNLVTGEKAKVGRDDQADGVRDCRNPECKTSSDVDAWEANAWRCPECNARRCKHCGVYEDNALWGGIAGDICPQDDCGKGADEPVEGFGRQAEHEVEADEGSPLIADVARQNGWLKVMGWTSNRHSKKIYDPTTTDSLRVEYICEFGVKVQEWVFFDHPAGSLPRKKAMAWWNQHGFCGHPIKVEGALDLWPIDVKEVLDMWPEAAPLRHPRWILVHKDEKKYDRIVDRSFEDELEEHRATGALW